MPPWITRTLLASEASSLLSQTHTLLQSIRRSGSPLLLFSLSKHLPSATLSALVTALQSSAPHNLGLLASDAGPFHLSLAAAPPNSLVQPFRSTLRGKPTIALGRELPPNLLKQRQVHPHQQQQDDLAVLHHHDHWHHLWGSTQHIHPLPTELMHLESVSSIHSNRLF